MHHRQKITQMKFIPHNQPPKVLQPCEQSLDLPSTFVASQLSAVLCSRLNSVRLMRCDKFHVSFISQLFVKLVRVVSPIADNFLRQIFRHAGIESFFHKRYFMRRSAACVHGERNTLSVAKAHDFGTFAAFGLADSVAPFLAGANVPSMKPSLRSMPPRSRKSSASAINIFSNIPDSVHCWNRRWQVLFGGYRSGKSFHCAPVRSIHKMPLRTSRGSTAGRPCLPGPLLGRGKYLEIRFHCSSVMSISLLKQRLWCTSS